MQGISKLEIKLRNWQSKAKQRRKEVEALRKRLAEVKAGRENWKSKYKAQKLANSTLKKLLVKRSSSKRVEKEQGLKPRHHSYPIWVIRFCMLIRQNGNVSLRGCQAVLKIVCMQFAIEQAIPTKTSIQNWEKKLGYYHLTDQPTPNGTWVLILDESISIGQDKLLLILGVNVSTYEFGEALNFGDTKLLFLGIAKSWTAVKISEQLEVIKASGLSIAYGVSDGGTNLVKSLKVSKIDRVEDCTHSIGNLLKKQYNKSEAFQAFSKQCGIFKRQVQLSQYAVYAPPKQRTKGRFLNIRELAKWAYKTLMLVSKQPEDNSMMDEVLKGKLQWLEDYQQLVVELQAQCVLMDKIFQIIKSKGLSQLTKEQCVQILEQSKCNEFFKQGVEAYLEKNILLQKEDVPLLCCSDIIESYFGKYKNQVAKNGRALITDACLVIGNYSQNFDDRQIKKAMEEVKIIDLVEWKKKNIPISFMQRKDKVFKNTG